MDKTRLRTADKRPAVSRLALRMAALVFLCSLAVVALISAYNHHVSRQALITGAEANAKLVGARAAEAIGRVLAPVERVITTLALTLEQSAIDPGAVYGIVRRTLEANPEIYGVAVAYPPYAFTPNHRFHAPYQFRTARGFSSTMLGGPDYDYFDMEWYRKPRESGRPSWSEPYFDDGGGQTLMVTFSVPWYRSIAGRKVFAGVVTGDVSLEWLDRLLSRIQLYDTGYAVALSASGTYIRHPIQGFVLHESIFSLGEKRNDPEMLEIGRNMIAGKTGFQFRSSIRGNVPSFLYYAPLPVGGWSLGLLLPQDEVLAGVGALTRDILLIGLVGVLCLAVLVFWVVIRLTRPVRALSDAALVMAEGRLDIAPPALERGDEIGVFARSFDAMRVSLAEHIRTLAETTAAKERIESELRIARDIQMGILPKVFPPAPNLPELELAASIEPAREVGGDLYDFFQIDSGRFCFLLGDVSDKGVPAALFMAVTKTLLGAVARQGLPPGAILARVNDDLAQGNESCMFVTLFLGLLDPRTGELEYACAGHDPPFLLRADGRVERLEARGDPMAGAMEGVDYATLRNRLDPGDVLLAWTDGVTEAENPAADLFGEERLRGVLAQAMGASPEALLAKTRAAVAAWAAGAEQNDDITLLALRFLKPVAERDTKPRAFEL